MKQVRFYILGEGCGVQADGTPLRSWPYELAYAPEHRPAEFYLSEGDGRNGNGGFFPATMVLADSWSQHLDLTGTRWLVPLLQRIADGETLRPAEILDAYLAQHGQPAPSLERAILT